MSNYKMLKKNPDGTILCPAGYPLRKMDGNIWRCEGGNHEYSMDTLDIVLDKFGNYIVKFKEGDEIEEK